MSRILGNCSGHKLASYSGNEGVDCSGGGAQSFASGGVSSLHLGTEPLSELGVGKD